MGEVRVEGSTSNTLRGVFISSKSPHYIDENTEAQRMHMTPDC